MIGAIGATDRQVRKVMLANGTAVGVVGATAGTVLGLITWFALRPAFENLVGHRIDALSLPYEVDQHTLYIGCSVGLATGPRDGRTAG